MRHFLLALVCLLGLAPAFAQTAPNVNAATTVTITPATTGTPATSYQVYAQTSTFPADATGLTAVATIPAPAAGQPVKGTFTVTAPNGSTLYLRASACSSLALVPCSALSPLTTRPITVNTPEAPLGITVSVSVTVTVTTP